MALDLSWNGADLRFADDLLYAEPRGLQGTTRGSADVRFPMVPGRQLLNGLSGDVTIEALDGTYGRMGFATQVLTVLRTTDALRLQMPSLQDEGLRFKESAATLVAREGVIEPVTFMLVDNAYRLTGGGWIHLPQDEMEVELGVFLLEGVAGPLRQVPVLGAGVDRIQQLAGVTVELTGPPFSGDPCLES